MPHDPYPAPVILTKVRTQGNRLLPFVALGPDFRQDDGSWLLASSDNV